MFLFNCRQFLDELQSVRPDILTACEESLTQGQHDLDFCRLDKTAFAACPSDSIDYAVMEHTQHAAVVPTDISGVEGLVQGSRFRVQGSRGLRVTRPFLFFRAVELDCRVGWRLLAMTAGGGGVIASASVAIRGFELWADRIFRAIALHDSFIARRTILSDNLKYERE